MEDRRTIIVTGGSRGIGATISRSFHEAGADVVLASRKDSGLASELGERARFIEADVCQPDALRKLVEQTLDWTGRVDTLVNNAGVSAWRPLAQIDEEFWQEMLDTNLKSALFACQAVEPHLPDGGTIINISSLAGKRGSANNSAYCAAKFAVNGITQSLAKELGPRGIRVNAVCPVYVSTDGLSEALRDADSPTGGGDIAEYFETFTQAQTALKRLPTARQVADTCVFLASPGAAAITGQCLNVDCGVLPQ